MAAPTSAPCWGGHRHAEPPGVRRRRAPSQPGAGQHRPAQGAGDAGQAHAARHQPAAGGRGRLAGRLKQWLPAGSAPSDNAVVGVRLSCPRSGGWMASWPGADIGSASLKAVHFTLGPVNQATEVMTTARRDGVVRCRWPMGAPSMPSLPASTGPARGPISARIPMSARTGHHGMPFPGSPSAAWIAASASCPWVR